MRLRLDNKTTESIKRTHNNDQETQLKQIKCFF